MAGRNSVRWVSIGALGLLGACASLPDAGTSAGASSEAKAAQVRQRAEARWAATIRGDNLAAYAYLSPASKNLLPLEQYILKAPRNIRQASVTGVNCSADSCKVAIELKYDTQLVKGVVTPQVETWILDKDQWWYVQRI
jgi:hypothetical protein